MSPTTASVDVLITATVSEPPGPVLPPVTVAYTWLPSGETATSCGYGPTSIGVSLPVAAFTAITWYWPVSATKICEPSGVTATPDGLSAEMLSDKIVSVATSTSAIEKPPASAT